jgi:hypothetical protein
MKQMVCFLLGFTMVVSFMLSMEGCSKSTGSGPNSCLIDTNLVTYQNDILPIMKAYCYNCHGNGNTAFGNGINLDGYDKDTLWAGVIYAAVTHVPDPTIVGMPYGKPKLPDCEINKIAAWLVKLKK